MEVTGSSIILTLQVEADGREGEGPGQGHPEVRAELGREWGSPDSQSHVLPSPVPPIRLRPGRDGRNQQTVRITGKETIHQRPFVVSGRGVNFTARVRRTSNAYLLHWALSPKGICVYSSSWILTGDNPCIHKHARVCVYPCMLSNSLASMALERPTSHRFCTLSHPIPTTSEHRFYHLVQVYPLLFNDNMGFHSMDGP